jgi:hypothetical protein
LLSELGNFIANLPFHIVYIYFSGRSLWQKSAEVIRSEHQLKRKNEDAVLYSYVKKRRMIELTNTPLEDDDDSDILVIDTDEDLIREMDELLCDLKLTV